MEVAQSIWFIFFIKSLLIPQNLPADCSCGEERREVCKVSSDPGGMDYIWNGRVTKVDTNYICKPTQRVSSNLWGKSVPLDGQVEARLWRESDCFQGKSSLIPDPSVEFSTLFFLFPFLIPPLVKIIPCVTSQYVLTAAHCVTFGDNNRKAEEVEVIVSFSVSISGF